MLEEVVYRLKGCFIQNTLQKVYETKTYKLERTFEKKKLHGVEKKIT